MPKPLRLSHASDKAQSCKSFETTLVQDPVIGGSRGWLGDYAEGSIHVRPTAAAILEASHI